MYRHQTLYVHESIYDVVAATWGIARRTVVGDGLEQSTEMGPIKKCAVRKGEGVFEDAGRTAIVASGGVLEQEGLFRSADDRAISPTTPGSCEEQFGPVRRCSRFPISTR